MKVRCVAASLALYRVVCRGGGVGVVESDVVMTANPAAVLDNIISLGTLIHFRLSELLS